MTRTAKQKHKENEMDYETKEGHKYKKCTVLGTALQLTEQSQTPCFMVMVSKPGGGTLSGKIWLTEKAFEKSVQRIREVLGDFSELSDLRDGERYIGVLCDVETEIQVNPNTGREYEQVKWFNRRGSVSVVDDSQFSLLEQRLGGLMARYNATRQTVQPPKRVQAEPESTPAGDDDLHF
jgi:hypothetical protein